MDNISHKLVYLLSINRATNFSIIIMPNTDRLETGILFIVVRLANKPHPLTLRSQISLAIEGSGLWKVESAFLCRRALNRPR